MDNLIQLLALISRLAFVITILTLIFSGFSDRYNLLGWLLYMNVGFLLITFLGVFFDIKKTLFSYTLFCLFYIFVIALIVLYYLITGLAQANFG